VIQSPIQSPVQNIIRNGIFDADGLGETVFKLHNSRIREVIRGLDGTFARATGATVKDHEDVIREVLSGEVRYQGQRRVENLITASEDFTDAAWALDSSGTGSNPVVTSDYSEGADRIQFDRGASTGFSRIQETGLGLGDYVNSIELKTFSGLVESV